MAKRTILDDARELLEGWAGPNPYGRVGKFVLEADAVTLKMRAANCTDKSRRRVVEGHACTNINRCSSCALIDSLRTRLGLEP